MPKTFVLSLGGSLIFPEDLDKKFLNDFKKIIELYVKKKYKFVIVCGGGKLARNMQEVAANANNLSNEELDWIGIHATKINAHLVNSIFDKLSNELVVSNPAEKVKFKKSVIVASGWKPGWSTDYDAVLLAKNVGSRQVINMSNVEYVYDKDPRKNNNAKKIEKLSWNDYRKMSGDKWTAGLSLPFDPIASKEAQKSRIKVNIIGKNLNNLKNLLDGKKFKGTIIE